MNADELRKLRKEAGLTQDQLAEKVGLNRRTIINYEKGENIPDSIVKLFHMIFSDKNDYTNLKSNDYPVRKTPFEELQEKWQKQDNFMVPLYDDVSTFGGDVEIDMEPVTQPTEYIHTGTWFGKTKITAAIRHYGDSMVEYPSGCILALKEIVDWKDNIVPGENYVVETNERRVTKKLQFKEGDESIFMAYSTNRETHADGTLIHQPFPLKKSKIRKVMLVVGRIVKEYSSGEVITY